VELFPFPDKYPGVKDFGKITVPVTLLANAADVESFQKEIANQTVKLADNKQEDTVIVAGGLTGLRIQRRKNSPDSQCTFQITGRVPRDAFPGTWGIVTSINVDKDGQERRLIRFIGQIYSMDPQYAVSGTGVLQTRTSLMMRSWSAALEAPVRYDVFAVINALPQNAAMAAIGNITQSFGAAGTKVSAAELQKVAGQSFNPFELAHLILKLIGAINTNDTLNGIKSLGALGLPEVAMTMPSVPQSLLQRLGLTSVDSENAFSTGFIDVITGVQQGGAYNDGSWNGVFGGGTTFIPPSPFGSISGVTPPAANLTIEAFKALFLSDVKDRPITLGLGALMSTGASAWQLITTHCDPALNEFFTDILYQPGKSDASIVAKPVVFVRDKPFLMKKLKSSIKDVNLDTWTIYDDLPRVRIDNVYITNLKLSNTFINSPNFIRVNFQPQVLEANTARNLSQIYGTNRLLPEMRRFGGSELFVETNFLSRDVINGKALDVKFDEWFKKIKHVVTSWHAYNYRMATGVLVMRDDNIPITLGFNLQFTIGKFELVGHVESVDVSFVVHEDGRHETVTQVQLSRVVNEIDGQLDFIAPDAFANLIEAEPAASPPVVVGSLAALLGV